MGTYSILAAVYGEGSPHTFTDSSRRGLRLRRGGGQLFGHRRIQFV
jgi:hypothetical protein